MGWFLWRCRRTARFWSGASSRRWPARALLSGPAVNGHRGDSELARDNELGRVGTKRRGAGGVANDVRAVKQRSRLDRLGRRRADDGRVAGHESHLAHRHKLLCARPRVRARGNRDASESVIESVRLVYFASSIMPPVVTIWPSTTVPGLVDGGPDSAVELGVKFKSDVAGTMKGIRFYKAAANTGVHIGNLWTSNGTRLATATFMSETASGWQQALFATPVTIASNTVYVASYHANNGHYSADLNYFLGKGVDNPPLHVLMNGVFGGNGVYAYGASSVFPNQTYSAANYWVDVVFQVGTSTKLTSIAVTPANPSILTGASQQFTATGTYLDGSVRDITSQVTWTSSNTAVATINAGGLATGVSDGTTIISALLAGVMGSTVLSVQPSQSSIHYVSLSGTHVLPFTSWHTAATNIQAAIDVALDGDTVLVTNGVYNSGGTVKPGYQLRNRVYITNAITLQSVHGPAVTVIDGQGSCRCVSIGAAAKLIGFTLTNGAAMGTSETWEQGGGGLFFDYASDVMASNCVITGNRAEVQGGGIYSALSTVTLQNLLVVGNSAQGWGGGLRTSYGSIRVINSAFQQNYSGDGGGIMLYHTDSTLRNLLLTGNSALRKGGGMTFDGCSPTLENITMVDNASPSNLGGALNVSYASQPTLRNCILWSNTPNQIVFDTDWGGMALTVDHCDIQGGLAGIPTYGLGPVTWLDGNLDTNPLFAAVGDYHLQCISPCINVGTNQDWMIGATDLDGNPRLYAGGRLDMGAYEYQGMSIWSNTTAPVVADGGPDSAVELGVKFKSDVAGTIKGIRFYKATANTGVHIGNLWTSNGTQLATATFTNETASGWQQVLFATPVTIASNTVYVASYHANNGHYSADLNYFLGKGVDNPPLHALMNGVFGGNGVYAYGASSLFPNQTYNAANYWVDVMFRAGFRQP